MSSIDAGAHGLPSYRCLAVDNPYLEDWALTSLYFAFSEYVGHVQGRSVACPSAHPLTRQLHIETGEYDRLRTGWFSISCGRACLSLLL